MPDLLVIGERKYRNRKVLDELNAAFMDYIFETLGLKLILATVLAHNRPMIRYMLRSGWNLDKTIQRHLKSQSDDTMLDLCFLSLSRETWRAGEKRQGAQIESA
jgi:RimJ/RimL family protein N-acetyltransferase